MQNECGINQGIFLLPKITQMARPGVFLRNLDNPCPDRIQMDITSQLQKILIFIAQNRPIPSLEQMPNLAVSLIEKASITELKDLHNPRQRSVLHFHQEMDMLCEALDYVKLSSYRYESSRRFPLIWGPLSIILHIIPCYDKF
jgi:hypothetical protein